MIHSTVFLGETFQSREYSVRINEELISDGVKNKLFSMASFMDETSG